jgi:hypothetical protein
MRNYFLIPIILIFFLNYSLATSCSVCFHGKPFAVPGVIQAEDFDLGGLGVSYNDTTSINSFAAEYGIYRYGAVDIWKSGNSWRLGQTYAGEWLEYTIDVKETGNYTIWVLGSNVRSGGNFHIKVNGVNVTGSMTFPISSSWTEQKWVSKNVNLTKGIQKLRLVMETNSTGGNVTGSFDLIEITRANETHSGGGYTLRPMTREEIIAIANKHIDLVWSPAETFITNEIPKRDGSGTYHQQEFRKGQTYYGVAYLWWGDDDVSEFYNKVRQTTGGLKAYGNDCSSLASLALRLPERYTTADFERDSTSSGGYVHSLGSIGSAANAGLIPGDLLNKSGDHIILVGEVRSDGIISLEQIPGPRRSTSEMRVFWSWHDLRNYRPIRRNLLVSTCTINNWVYSDGQCQSNNTLTRTWTKIGICEGGITKTNETVLCNYDSPVCEYEYSDYGECVNGLQMRSVILKNTGDCQGSPQALIRVCETTPICTESHWYFTLDNCVDGKQNKVWEKISDCVGGIQRTTEIIDCSDEQLIRYCGSNDWESRIEPEKCPETGVQTRYWTRTNADCQGGLTYPAQQTITCTPEQVLEPEIECITNFDCQWNEKCEQNICITITCEDNETINNHECVRQDSTEIDNDIIISIYDYISLETIETIKNSGNEEAIQLLQDAEQSIINNEEYKASTQINVALLKIRTLEKPELIEVYQQALIALNEGDYSTANILSLQTILCKASIIPTLYPKEIAELA